jgi:hypothetical protein
MEQIDQDMSEPAEQPHKDDDQLMSEPVEQAPKDAKDANE